MKNYAASGSMLRTIQELLGKEWELVRNVETTPLSQTSFELRTFLSIDTTNPDEDWTSHEIAKKIFSLPIVRQYQREVNEQIEKLGKEKEALQMKIDFLEKFKSAYDLEFIMKHGKSPDESLPSTSQYRFLDKSFIKPSSEV